VDETITAVWNVPLMIYKKILILNWQGVKWKALPFINIRTYPVGLKRLSLRVLAFNGVILDVLFLRKKEIIIKRSVWLCVSPYAHFYNQIRTLQHKWVLSKKVGCYMVCKVVNSTILKKWIDISTMTLILLKATLTWELCN
jgi:hypothetical protein